MACGENGGHIVWVEIYGARLSLDEMVTTHKSSFWVWHPAKLIFTAEMDARVKWNMENFLILTFSSSKFEDIAWV